MSGREQHVCSPLKKDPLLHPSPNTPFLRYVYVIEPSNMPNKERFNALTSWFATIGKRKQSLPAVEASLKKKWWL